MTIDAFDGRTRRFNRHADNALRRNITGRDDNEGILVGALERAIETRKREIRGRRTGVEYP